MRRKVIVLFLLFPLIISRCFPVGFSIIEVINFLAKVSDKISGIEKEFDKYQSEFREYYNKYWKNFNRKFFPRELEKLKMKDPSGIYLKPYVDIESNDEVWSDIYKNPKYLWKRYRYLVEVKHYKNNELYRKDRKFREKMDENIKDMKLYLKEMEKAIRLIADSRKMQKRRGLKIYKYKLKNDLLGMPKAYWEAKRVKLMTFGAMLDLEIQHQVVELIMLMNVKTELKIKSELLIRNMLGRERDFNNSWEGRMIPGKR